MSVVYRSYKVKLYPNEAQKRLIILNMKYSAIVYNTIVKYERNTYKAYNAYLKKCKKENIFPSPDYIEKVNRIPTLSQIKNMRQNNYLKQADSIALDDARLDVKNGYNLFFKGINKNRPLYKSVKNAKAYTTRCIRNNIRFNKNRLRLPKIGFVRCKNYIKDYYSLNIVKVTIKTDLTNRFYAIITYIKQNTEDNLYISNSILKESIGLDFNIESVFVDNNGNRGKHSEKIYYFEEKISKLFYNLKGKKYESRKWNTTIFRIRQLYTKIKNLRRNSVLNMADKIIKAYKYVFIETISIKEIVRDVLVKADVYDCKFYNFCKTIEYKLKEMGGALLRVNKWFPSSKKCSNCGNIKKDLSKIERVYICENCHEIIDRDINAAINIRREGIKNLLKNSW